MFARNIVKWKSALYSFHQLRFKIRYLTLYDCAICFWIRINCFVETAH